MKKVSVVAIVVAIGLIVSSLGYAASQRYGSTAATTAAGNVQAENQAVTSYGPGMRYGYGGYGMERGMMYGGGHGRGYGRGGWMMGRGVYDGGSGYGGGYCPMW